MRTYRGLLLLALAVGLFVLAYDVWPTPYETVAGFQPSGHDWNPGTGGLQAVTGYRRVRLSGRLQERMGGRWYSVSCGFGCMADDPNFARR